MCGIAGMINREQPVEKIFLDHMAARLQHRGPDACGFHLQERVGLVHTRLSIIDLQGGDQPLYSRDRNLVLVANGEIYNYIELRRELMDLGHEFLTHSDCEVIIHGYRQWGEAFVKRLHGMFAFALYDHPQQKIWLGRDRLGMKPLYFSLMDSKSIAFASEIKALLSVTAGGAQINPAALADYLQSQCHHGPETIIKGIYKVMPAELVCINRFLGVHRQTYWDPCQVQTRGGDLAQAHEAFDELMDQVMREHMRADVPFGLFLSGGVDSSILLASLTRLQDRPLRTFSVGFPGTQINNELPVANELAARFNSEHTVLECKAADMLQRLPYSVWCADELMRDNANLPTSLLAQTAGRELKVVFSGEGGDEAFAGYGRYRPGFEAWIKNMRFPGSAGFRTRGTFPPSWSKRVFQQPLLDHQFHFRQPVIEAWEQCAHFSKLQRMQWTDMRTALADNLLVKGDRMLMGFALEGRMPFVDHRIIEFGLSLPDTMKINGNTGKFFLKTWASRWLPKSVLFAKKQGFQVPMGEWLQGDYLAKTEKILLADKAVIHWFQAAGIKKLVRRQKQQKKYNRHLWAIVQFALWNRLVLEGSGDPPPESADPLALLE